MDIKRRSIGLLLDDFVTTCMKLWHEQELERNPDTTDEELGKAFRRIQKLNIRRNALINAFDELLDKESFTTTKKTYEK